VQVIAAGHESSIFIFEYYSSIVVAYQVGYAMQQSSKNVYRSRTQQATRDCSDFSAGFQSRKSSTAKDRNISNKRTKKRDDKILPFPFHFPSSQSFTASSSLPCLPFLKWQTKNKTFNQVAKDSLRLVACFMIMSNGINMLYATVVSASIVLLCGVGLGLAAFSLRSIRLLVDRREKENMFDLRR
jgi:hypothetical protein